VDWNLSLAVGGVGGQEPSIGDMASDNVSQPSRGMKTLNFLHALSQLNLGQSVHDLNLSLAVGGVGSQATFICDMASDNVSQHSRRFNGMPTLKNLFPSSGHERPQQELKKIDCVVLNKQIFLAC
ncbi:hypothetical protein Tco_0495683, partial [Tanacetum coccineum]